MFTQVFAIIRNRSNHWHISEDACKGEAPLLFVLETMLSALWQECNRESFGALTILLTQQVPNDWRH